MAAHSVWLRMSLNSSSCHNLPEPEMTCVGSAGVELGVFCMLDKHSTHGAAAPPSLNLHNIVCTCV